MDWLLKLDNNKIDSREEVTFKNIALVTLWA